LQISIRSIHSRRTVRTHRSAYAFARGARCGLRKTSANTSVYLASRSRIKNRNCAALSPRSDIRLGPSDGVAVLKRAELLHQPGIEGSDEGEGWDDDRAGERGPVGNRRDRRRCEPTSNAVRPTATRTKRRSTARSAACSNRVRHHTAGGIARSSNRGPDRTQQACPSPGSSRRPPPLPARCRRIVAASLSGVVNPTW
jgi:hypothetical protein